MSAFESELLEVGLPDGVVAAESIVTSTQMSPNVKFACLLALEGASYKDAADVFGLDRRHVYAVMKRHGATHVHDFRQHERGRVILGLRLARRSAELNDLTPAQLAKLV